VTLLLPSAAALGLGLLISATVSEPSQATVALPMACFPQVLFVGAILPVPAMAAVGRWISYAMANRWAFEALGHSLGVAALRANGRSTGQHVPRHPVLNVLKQDRPNMGGNNTHSFFARPHFLLLSASRSHRQQSASRFLLLSRRGAFRGQGDPVPAGADRDHGQAGGGGASSPCRASGRQPRQRCAGDGRP
jgi:ABC-2 family transporter